MKDKITLGKAGKVFGEIKEVEVEYDAGTALPAAVFEEALAIGKANLKLWGLGKSLVINSGVHELQEYTKQLLTQPGQFFILTEHELEAVRFMSCLFESISPFFVSKEAIEGGALETRNRRSLPHEGVSHITRRFPSNETEGDYALVLGRFLSKDNIPLILSALGIFTSGRAESLDTLTVGIRNGESKEEDGAMGTIERRFVTRAAITLYHDWLAVTNPKRHSEFNWTLPPIVIKNLEDLRMVNAFFFKALPAFRETNVAAMVSPGQLFKLIPGDSETVPNYLLAASPSFDISQDLGDLILAIAKDSPEAEDFDYINHEDHRYEKLSPSSPKYWERDKIEPGRAGDLAAACRRLDYVAHDLADLASLILTFKYRTPVIVGGRSFTSDVVEFVVGGGRTGRGYNFLETGCELVDIPQSSLNEDSPGTYNPLLRAYVSALEGLNEAKRENAYAYKGRLRRDGFQRTQRRLVEFQKWFGKELFVVAPCWL